MNEPISLRHLPPAYGPPQRGGRIFQAASTENNYQSHHAPGRQRLLAERALLQLAWVGLVALREGYTCPAPHTYTCAPPPEECPETVEAELVPDAEGRGITAYRQAARLSEPRAVRLVDTLA